MDSTNATAQDLEVIVEICHQLIHRVPEEYLDLIIGQIAEDPDRRRVYARYLETKRESEHSYLWLLPMDPRHVPSDPPKAAKIIQCCFRRGHLIDYWNAGLIVATHQDRGGYGSAAVPKIAAHLDQTDRWLWELGRFYMRFPDPDVLIDLDVPWSVAREIARVKDADARLSLLEKASRWKWSVRRVRREVFKEA